MKNLKTLFVEKLTINSKSKINGDWSIKDAQNGDIIGSQYVCFIFKDFDNGKFSNSHNAIIYHACCDLEFKPRSLSIGPDIGVGSIKDDQFYHYRLASNEECNKFFDLLKQNGYKWDNKKMELIKI